MHATPPLLWSGSKCLWNHFIFVVIGICNGGRSPRAANPKGPVLPWLHSSTRPVKMDPMGTLSRHRLAPLRRRQRTTTIYSLGYFYGSGLVFLQKCLCRLGPWICTISSSHLPLFRLVERDASFFPSLHGRRRVSTWQSKSTRPVPSQPLPTMTLNFRKRLRRAGKPPKQSPWTPKTIKTMRAKR